VSAFQGCCHFLSFLSSTTPSVTTQRSWWYLVAPKIRRLEESESLPKLHDLCVALKAGRFICPRVFLGSLAGGESTLGLQESLEYGLFYFICFNSLTISQGPSLPNTQARPTTSAYMMSGGKQLAATLKNLADVIPVPFLSEFVEVAVTVIEACKACIQIECIYPQAYGEQDSTAIEESVKDLQERVHQLTLRIVDTVPIVGGVSEELQARIKDLQSFVCCRPRLACPDLSSQYSQRYCQGSRRDQTAAPIAFGFLPRHK
jgi:hypothetical protein